MEPKNLTIQLCRAYGVEQFESAETNAIFMCGMQPLDADGVMHDVIVTSEALECHHPVEFEYFNNPKQNYTIPDVYHMMHQSFSWLPKSAPPSLLPLPARKHGFLRC